MEALRGTEPGVSVFDLLSAIGAHDHGRAIRILARNVENGEAPLRILGALVWQYRRLWKLKDQMKSGGREGRRRGRSGWTRHEYVASSPNSPTRS